jgi:hypothetical protein
MHGLTNDVMLRKDLILLRDLSHMDQGRKRFLARGWPCGKAGRRLSTGALQGASVRELGRPNWQSSYNWFVHTYEPPRICMRDACKCAGSRRCEQPYPACMGKRWQHVTLVDSALYSLY